MTTTAQLIIARAMSEDQLAAHVKSTCRDLRVWAWHDQDPRRNIAGLPDWLIVGRWVMYRELKTETGRPSAAQRDVIARLEAAGADVAVWRPHQWVTGDIQRELLALAGCTPHSFGQQPEERTAQLKTDGRGAAQARPGRSGGPNRARATASANKPGRATQPGDPQ